MLTSNYIEKLIGLKSLKIQHRQRRYKCCCGQQVIRIFKEISISRPATLPAILSIDEFKGNAANPKYQVLITDKKRTILDILPKRTTSALIQYFRQFPLHVRHNVSFITVDMSHLLIYRK